MERLTQTQITGGTLQGIGAAHYVHIENFTVHNSTAAEPLALSGEISSGLIPPCPYPGLAYFAPEDAARFFGRDEAIAKLRARISQKVFSVLVGASGSGKSSVVLAGLAPRLDALEDWRFSYFRIGTESDKNPFRAVARALVPLLSTSRAVEQMREIEELGRALQERRVTFSNVLSDCVVRSGGKHLLLIADQFEEVFTLIAEKNDASRRQFIDMLLSGFCPTADAQLTPLRLVLTLRADFYGMALRHRPLADALQDNVENLGPMTRDELQAAIVKPARDTRFDDGLVATLIDEIVKRPGSLPLLQFALREMWPLQESRRLTRASYDSIGGIQGALARRAQGIYDSLTQNGRDEAEARRFRHLFTRLVNLGEGAEDTRRVVDRGELDPNVWELAQRLAGESNRLIVTTAAAPNRETAEVAHEALIRGWPMLIDWINRDRSFLSWIDQLKPRVKEWRADRSDDGTLLRGGPLAVAEDWLRRRNEEINAEEREFIQESIKTRDAARRRDEAARQAEVQRQKDLALEAQRIADREAGLRRQAEKDRDVAEVATKEARAATAAAQAANGRARIALAICLILLLVVGIIAFLFRVARLDALKETARAQQNLEIANKAKLASIQQKNLAIFSSGAMKEIAGAASDEAWLLSGEAQQAVDSGSLRDQIQTYLDFAKHFELDWKPTNGKLALQKLDEAISAHGSSGWPSSDAEVQDLNRLLVYRHEIAGDLEFTNSSEPMKSPNQYLEALALFDKSNASRGDKARILAKLARVRLYYGDPAEAVRVIGQAVTVLGSSPADTFDSAFLEDVKARLFISQGDLGAARASTEKAISILTSVIATRDDGESVIYLAGALQRLGDLDRYSQPAAAVESYKHSLALFEGVARQDPTSFTALAAIDTIRHSLRLLGAADEVDTEVASRRSSTVARVEREFAEGLGPFRFGMPPKEVNALLPRPFDERSLGHLPQGGEYRWTQVGYFWVNLDQAPSLKPFEGSSACVSQHGYVSFVFHEQKLFRVVVRVFGDDKSQCPAISTLLDDFASRYGLTTSGSREERRIRYQTSRVAINAETEAGGISLDFIQR